MPSQPFTAAGVAAKTTELYALSDSLLFAQANAAESDFKLWISNNFTLTTGQSSFLTTMNSSVTKYFGSQCSMAFRSRLTITLTLGGVPTPPSPKWVKSDSTLAVSADGSGKLITTGALAFYTEYHA